MLSPERILEVKEAFLNALEKAHVPKAKMDAIRARRGLPAEMDVAPSKAARVEVLKARYTPLSRALVRELLDQYAKYGKGYTNESAREVSYDDYQAAWNTSRMDADTFIARLLGRAAADAETLGASALKNVLGMVYDNDLQIGLIVGENSSITRKFSALILSQKSNNNVDVATLVNGKYNTGILEEMAERAIAGEDVGNCKAALDAYHEKLVQDNANLPEEMKAMLGKVANIPLEKPASGDGESVGGHGEFRMRLRIARICLADRRVRDQRRAQACARGECGRRGFCVHVARVPFREQEGEESGSRAAQGVRSDGRAPSSAPRRFSPTPT